VAAHSQCSPLPLHDALPICETDPPVMVSPIRPTVPDEIDKLGPGKPVASSAAPVVLFRVSVFDSIENEPSQVPLIRSTAPSRAPSIAGCSAEGFAAQSIFVAA